MNSTARDISSFRSARPTSKCGFLIETPRFLKKSRLRQSAPAKLFSLATTLLKSCLSSMFRVYILI
ncbi:hypothetical protein LPU83_pLPU83d_0715 (plasmid) [Rhizobium favelukesii]|uniref:Uncharacterized protein n=1 Tax=Rhizobium favelukesii TaxID=348824 RepID=W6RPJ0_9HYPH|nr:hypothetical protein LPU83_pLPU83d_0715 [Rhizobium favelukesii]